VARAAKAPSSPTQILRDAAKSRAPVYLLVGEPSETEGIARRLIDVFVPEEKRSTNLETYEGRATPLATVLDSCRTVGLFGGGKVVWVREPGFLASGEKRSDIADALLTAWAADHRKQAADKLLLLAALAGWDQGELDATSFAALTKTKLKAFLGRDPGEGEGAILDAAKAAAQEAEMTVASHRDDGVLLEDFLESGAAGDTVLILTSTVADRRKRVFKTIDKRGVCAELTVARERSGAMTREAVEAIVDDVIASWGKTATPGARRAIAQRAGGAPGWLKAELEKLCLYVGDAEKIEEHDVAAIMRDLGESWVFDFTGALSQRDTVKALSLLRGLFAQGEPPLRLLAMISREIRILLAAREILSTSLARAWAPGTQYGRFRDQMLPGIPEEQKQMLGGMHPYVLYLALQNASRITAARLERALLELHDLDIAFKSSRTDPLIRMEAFVLGFARR
jgi:DNA polymerase III delta subunit